MDKLIESVKLALTTQNWYGALAVALTLPDIAGKIEYPGAPSTRRSIQWYNRYLGDQYEEFLNGNDYYAFRCSLLHEGGAVITNQQVRTVLNDFIFVAPVAGKTVHCNMQMTVTDPALLFTLGNVQHAVLQLQVDIFCNDILNAVMKWLLEIEGDEQKQSKLNDFFTVRTFIF